MRYNGLADIAIGRSRVVNLYDGTFRPTRVVIIRRRRVLVVNTRRLKCVACIPSYVCTWLDAEGANPRRKYSQRTWAVWYEIYGYLWPRRTRNISRNRRTTTKFRLKVCARKGSGRLKPAALIVPSLGTEIRRMYLRRCTRYIHRPTLHSGLLPRGYNRRVP